MGTVNLKPLKISAYAMLEAGCLVGSFSSSGCKQALLTGLVG